MRSHYFGSNVAVFIIFFGIATISAFRSGNWTAALFWVAIGIVFARADGIRASRAARRMSR